MIRCAGLGFVFFYEPLFFKKWHFHFAPGGDRVRVCCMLIRVDKWYKCNVFAATP